MNEKRGFPPLLFNFTVLMLGLKNWVARRAQVVAQLINTVILGHKFYGIRVLVLVSGLVVMGAFVLNAPLGRSIHQWGQCT